jgi:hypothetical protein
MLSAVATAQTGTPPAGEPAPAKPGEPAAPSSSTEPAQAAPPPATPAPPAVPTSPSQPGAPPGPPQPGYPPPAYPPPGYPPPGYGAYPPYGPYPYPYYYARQPPRSAPPIYPGDAAAQSSPFFEALVGGMNFGNRFGSFFAVGAQTGVFAFRRVRVAARALIFPSEPEDKYGSDTEFTFDEPAPGFVAQESAAPSALFGGSVGYALISGTNFVLSPGVLFAVTDESQYGSFLAVNFPFDWVTDSGLRIGFDLAVGRSMGGAVRAQCLNTNGAPTLPCDLGEVRDFDRAASAGFYSHFHLGWGFNRPRPILPHD